MGKKYYNTHDRKIDIKDVLKTIGKKWFVIVSCAILCASIMLVLMHRKDYNAAVEANLNANATSAATIYNLLTDGEKSAVQLAKAQEEQLQTQKDYISQSVFMKINPYKEGNIVINCNINDTTNYVQNVIAEYVKSNTFYEDVADNMTIKLEVQYIKELISHVQNVDMDGYAEFSVKVIADSQELCEDIANAAEYALRNYTDKIQNKVSGCLVDIYNSGYSEMVDAELYNKQYSNTSAYYNLQVMYNATVQSFTDNMSIVYSATDDELVADVDNTSSDNTQEINVPYRIKYAVLGGIIGAVLGAFAVLLFYLSNGNIKTEDDVENIYGLNVLGNMKKKEFVYANIANICGKRAIKKAILFGTDSSENNSALKELADYMQEKGVALKIVEDVNKNVESREVLGEYQYAFIVFKNKKTKCDEIEEWLKTCCEIDVNVVGAVAID